MEFYGLNLFGSDIVTDETMNLRNSFLAQASLHLLFPIGSSSRSEPYVHVAGSFLFTNLFSLLTGPFAFRVLRLHHKRQLQMSISCQFLSAGKCCHQCCRTVLFCEDVMGCQAQKKNASYCHGLSFALTPSDHDTMGICGDLLVI